jgi:hypothetical protein
MNQIKLSCHADIFAQTIAKKNQKIERLRSEKLFGLIIA